MKGIRKIVAEMDEIRTRGSNAEAQLRRFKKEIACDILRIGLLKIKQERILSIRNLVSNTLSKYS